MRLALSLPLQFRRRLRAAVVRELASTVRAPLAATLPAAVVRLSAASVAVLKVSNAETFAISPAVRPAPPPVIVRVSEDPAPPVMVSLPSILASAAVT